MAQWLYDGLHEAGLEPGLLETRHVKTALSAMAVKTDRRDARGSLVLVWGDFDGHLIGHRQHVQKLQRVRNESKEGGNRDP